MNLNQLHHEGKTIIDNFMNQSFESLSMEKLNNKETLIVIVDMVNGFAKKGALYSDRVENIIMKQKKFLEGMDQTEICFLCDAHPENSLEFDVFPPHCIEHSEEAEIVEALKPFVTSKNVIHKVTTNGYLEKPFQELIQAKVFKNVLIIGCCTDLCILQLSLSLKTHYHKQHQNNEIIIPIDLVDTYHLDITNHPGDFMHIIALKMMADNGIKLMHTGEKYDMVK